MVDRSPSARLRSFALAALLACSSFATAGCAEARQGAGFGMLAAGAVVGGYGIATVKNRCTSPLFSPDCADENAVPGDATHGVPMLMAGGVLAIAGAVLVLTAHPKRSYSGTIP